jgi:hypothetical protein
VFSPASGLKSAQFDRKTDPSVVESDTSVQGYSILDFRMRIMVVKIPVTDWISVSGMGCEPCRWPPMVASPVEKETLLFDQSDQITNIQLI